MDIYTVKRGETIDDITSRFKVTTEDLEKVNDDIDLLREGDEINIPFILSDDFNYYEVTAGDTLEKIARDRNLDVKTIAHLNGLDLKDYIYPKQVLILPKDGIEIYITEKGDTINDLEKTLNSSIDVLIRDNPNIYVVENQLLVKREKK